MSYDDVAIRVTNLSKRYEIYDTPHDRLKQFVIPRIRRMLGKPQKQYFRDYWALKDVSFELKKGETVGIIGRNGSGKSTLLQLICGTLTPTAGSVETRGRIAALLELGSGFNPEFTGRENIYMNAAVLGLSREEIDTRFDDIVAFAGIGRFIEQPVKTYSSGMYVRLAFAINIVSRPDIMIVDEALAVGDMAFQAKCVTALKRIQDRGTTVLFVSHDIGALTGLCTRGVYLDYGAIRAIGPAGDVAQQYIRSMREEMNAEHTSTKLSTKISSETKNQSSSQQLTEHHVFKVSSEFEMRVADFRYGEGGAKITFAELLDEHHHPVNNTAFDQLVFIRIYFETSIEDELSCNYYVADNKKNLILGAGLRLVGHPLLHVTIGGKYIVTYKTRLPLQEGHYSIQLQITKTVVQNKIAKYLDVIDDALVFKMAAREDVVIWTKAFIENEVESHHVS